MLRDRRSAELLDSKQEWFDCNLARRAKTRPNRCGFQVGLYLNVSNETRRLMWTLAHMHGTLLSLVHVGFAATLHLVRGWKPGTRSLASACLMSATLLIPPGFFLGGVVIYAGDPGL